MSFLLESFVRPANILSSGNVGFIIELSGKSVQSKALFDA